MSQKRYNVTVILNVYDLHPCNGCLWYIGFGLYHCGVQLKYDESVDRHSKEYSFLGNTLNESTGVFHCEPRQTFGAKWRTSLEMGTVQISNSELSLILDKLRSKFLSKDYDILTKNCNHFCAEFVYELTTKRTASWINRMASIGACCNCCIPHTFYDALFDIQMSCNQQRNGRNTLDEPNNTHTRTLSFSGSLSSWFYSNSYLGQQINKKSDKQIMKNGQNVESESTSDNGQNVETDNYMKYGHSISVIGLKPSIEPATLSTLGINPLKCNAEKYKKYGLNIRIDNGESDSGDSPINWDNDSYQEMPKTPSYLKHNDSITSN